MLLKTLSWNIWCGKYQDDVISLLKKLNPDIIGLQEVLENEIEKISKRLGFEFAYTTNFVKKEENKTLNVGNAVLSKFRILDNKSYTLSKNLKRCALETKIKVNNKIIHALSIHPIHHHLKPSNARLSQINNLIKILPKDPTVLMGDFNSLPQSKEITKISKILKNTDNKFLPTWAAYKEGCHVCRPELKYKLDYIFVSKDIKVKSFEVIDSQASDHLPVMSTIEL